MDAAVSHRMWTLYEPVHAVTYFAPEVGAAWSAAGVDGFWRGYFAGRAAPLAPCPPEVVTSTFFGFAPDFVARAIPSVWDLISPEEALDVRRAGAVAALHVALGPDAARAVDEAGEILAAAAGAADLDGRPLFAANAAVARPAAGLDRLWQAATLLREHRGDTHVAACVAAGLSGLEASAVAVAAGPPTSERLQHVRGWTPEQWDGARAGLVDRGLVDAAGEITPTGTALRTAVEAATDRSSLRPWEAVGAAGVARLEAVLEPIVDRLLLTDVLPFPNPIGVPRPA